MLTQTEDVYRLDFTVPYLFTGGLDRNYYSLSSTVWDRRNDESLCHYSTQDVTITSREHPNLGTIGVFIGRVLKGTTTEEKERTE